MKEYKNKVSLVEGIQKSSEFFIAEFNDIKENDKSLLLDGVDRSPAEIIAYQLGWLNLIRSWDNDETNGIDVVTPSINYKWNNLGGLYKEFCSKYKEYTLQELINIFKHDVKSFIDWVNTFDENELFTPGSRKWASSTASNWPIWK